MSSLTRLFFSVLKATGQDFSIASQIAFMPSFLSFANLVLTWLPIIIVKQSFEFMIPLFYRKPLSAHIIYRIFSDSESIKEFVQS